MLVIEKYKLLHYERFVNKLAVIPGGRKPLAHSLPGRLMGSCGLAVSDSETLKVAGKVLQAAGSPGFVLGDTGLDTASGDGRGASALMDRSGLALWHLNVSSSVLWSTGTGNGVQGRENGGSPWESLCHAMQPQTPTKIKNPRLLAPRPQVPAPLPDSESKACTGEETGHQWVVWGSPGRHALL